MLRILKDTSGNVAIAMLLAVIAMMSGLTISSMALRDTLAQQAEYEGRQGLHLLRSEAFRGQAVLENAGIFSGDLFTPQKNVEMSGSHYAKTFTMQSRIFKEKEESSGYVINVGGVAVTGSTGESKDYYKIQSLVETKSGVGQVAYFNRNKSIVRKYGELIVVQGTFAEFMYFTDNDMSPNDTNVYFYGYDVITGKVHSNSDIRIKQAGGGNNNNWPTFLNLVTTSGHVYVGDGSSQSFPRDQVFRGGLQEEYDLYEFPIEARTLRANSGRLGPTSYDENAIIFVSVDGAAYEAQWGRIQAPRRVFADVYAQYPPVTGEALYRNNFNVRDTLWAPLTGPPIHNRGTFVEAKLWLKGNFAGFQTWGSADTLSLIGDITLQGTVVGQNPASNNGSLVGIVSEKSILVKYAYKNPQDSTRVWPNCGRDDEFVDPAGGGIWIYAALCALGYGQGNSFMDGVFTFEYQHPHISIPAQTIVINGEPTYFDWIDLHRRPYPPSPGNAWPPLIDLPWYNPIWPEGTPSNIQGYVGGPYLERGTINIWGALAQRRRGFVHRSHNDTEYPSNSGVWNVPLDMCGGTTAIANNTIAEPAPISKTLATRNYPGAAGSGVGYKKNYNYDNRLLTTSPLFYPEVQLRGDKKPMEQGNWLLKKPPARLR